MHQRCVICSVRSWSSAYQISWSRSLCTLSASAPTAHWSACHLLSCSCDLNIWSLYIHLLLLLVMICDQFTEFKVLKLACAFGLVFNASDIPILISPPPALFFSFLQTISKSVSSSSQSDIFHQILSSWWAAFGLVFKACALHPPTGQCWSKQRQEAAGYLSTTIYHINKCLQNKKRKYSKKISFYCSPWFLQNSLDPILPPPTCIYKYILILLYLQNYMQCKAKNYISYSNFWGNIAMFLKQW